ncbi:hypothetical protein P0L94_14585 [Microbacter sp. GSS18]|nr:hypothetical protein P0L94_14585 [Microbacter sp. GSS18]
MRASKGVRRKSTPAMYYWQRTASHVWCESQEERWAVLWLDYGGQVERLWAQPMAIGFGHGSRLWQHWHIPDLLAQFADGSYGLFDVRPAERIDDLAQAQFNATAAARSSSPTRPSPGHSITNRPRKTYSAPSRRRRPNCSSSLSS